MISSARQKGRCGQGLLHVWVALSFLVLHLMVKCVADQQSSPLVGQGLPPTGPNCTNVYLSVLLYKLLTVDQNLYQFEAIMDAYITWRDPRARKYMVAEAEKLARWQANETALDGLGGVCEHPSSEACTNQLDDIVPKDADVCSRPCYPGSPLCCDKIWLPGFDIYNAIAFSQDGFVTENISVIGTVVMRMVRIYGRFTTPMSFRSFPIDSQKLQVIFRAQAGGNFCVVESALSKNSMVLPLWYGSSDDLSTWDIKDTGLTWGNLKPEAGVPFRNTSTAPDKNDPLPVTMNEGLRADVHIMVIHINRQFRYYFWNLIFPVVVTVVLAFVTFLIAPKYIEVRLATSVTLMVALAALQWSITSQMPSISYLTNMHRLVLMSYFMITLTNVESLFVYFLVRDDFPKREKDPDYDRRLAESLAHESEKGSQDDQPPPEASEGWNPRPFKKPLEERITPEPIVHLHHYMRSHPYRAYRIATHMDRVALVTFPLTYFISMCFIFAQ